MKGGPAPRRIILIDQILMNHQVPNTRTITPVYYGELKSGWCNQSFLTLKTWCILETKQFRKRCLVVNRENLKETIVESTNDVDVDRLIHQFATEVL